MKYMILIYSDESNYPKMSESDMAALMKDYETFTDELRSADAFVEANRLQPSVNATTVRVRGGETLTTDGPFAETKEQFGGYYVIEADDLDRALGWAAKCPTARYGSIEVRPLWE